MLSTGLRSSRSIIAHLVFIAILLALSIHTASASETLFYLVKKADWNAQVSKPSYYSPTLSKDGFISLLTEEQVIPTAHALFANEPDLLLVKINIPGTDPLLKWETMAGSEVSLPHYYGDLSRKFVQKIYALRPRKDGRFALPNDPFMKRVTAHVLPKALVNKFLSYHDWQKTDRFHRLQVDNFMRPKVQLQWWYFDFFLRDGSSVVMAFIPQDWWDKPGSTQAKKAIFTMSLRTRQGAVKRFTFTTPQADLKTSADHLEIPSHLVIQSVGAGEERTYSIQVNFPEVAGVFSIQPTQPPFAAFPTGVMPGIVQTLLRGNPLGSPSFSYVSQVPNSTVSGSLAWGDSQLKIDGQAYHEQGRLNDTPDRQGGSWTWYHFSGDGWNIFGTPGSYIYLQQGDRVIRSGFHLVSKDYTLQNRTFSSPDHAKILTGGEIFFRHENVSFRLKLPPSSARTLVCFPSLSPTQVWGTVEGPATLSISDGSTEKTLAGRMFLESCSWETSGDQKPPVPSKTLITQQ